MPRSVKSSLCASRFHPHNSPSQVLLLTTPYWLSAAVQQIAAENNSRVLSHSSVGQEPGESIAGGSGPGSLMRLSSRCRLGASRGLTEAGPFPSSLTGSLAACGFSGCWLERSGSSPQGCSQHCSFSLPERGREAGGRGGERERASALKMEATVL